ncbi:hypothetical protein B0H19DRAFT_380169 [Mycena capillaripes]|nr:hypothetical protein B0H19DRAFT_380169 [Mycena capillaripes]
MPMHPALQLENLATLRPSLRRSASLMLTSNAANTRRIHGDRPLICITPRENILPFLPVWYANLDCAHIPSPDTIDAAQAIGHAVDGVSGAAYSLQAITMLHDAPQDVYPELWSRAWPWMQFLHTYHEHLLALPVKKQLYATFTGVIVHFQISDNGLRLVASTPGIRAVMGAAWDVLIDGNDAEPMRKVSFFINYDLGSNFWSVGQYLEGSGGGIDHLASMIVKQLQHAAVDARTPMSKPDSLHFSAATTFILRLRKGFSGPSCKGIVVSIARAKEFSEQLDAAAIRHGIVPTLVAGICSLALAPSAHRNGLELLTYALNIVAGYSTTAPGRLRICEALQAGILRAVVLVASAGLHSDELYRQLDFILASMLPSYMVYRSILLQMPTFFADVEQLVKAETFNISPLLASWQRFHALVQERLAFLARFDSTPCVLYKGCDNMECGQISLKAELRRCSTCLDLYYCSKQCQKVDWRAGHRDACRRFAGLRRLPEEMQCSLQDRAFLRALLHHDYLIHRQQVYTKQISAWAEETSQLCYIVFNYMKGPVSIVLRPWESGILDHPQDWVTRHHNHGCRAAKSRRLLEVHLMAIPNGTKTHWKIIPMRHIGSEVPDKLFEIARKVARIPTADPAFESTVTVELEPLLAMDPQVIHE